MHAQSTARQFPFDPIGFGLSYGADGSGAGAAVAILVPGNGASLPAADIIIA